jgi:hypothetical protein
MFPHEELVALPFYSVKKGWGKAQTVVALYETLLSSTCGHEALYNFSIQYDLYVGGVGNKLFLEAGW